MATGMHLLQAVWRGGSHLHELSLSKLGHHAVEAGSLLPDAVELKPGGSLMLAAPGECSQKQGGKKMPPAQALERWSPAQALER